MIPDGDVFVHAGDMCRRGTLAELGVAARWLAEMPHRHKVIIAGNHDWPFVRTPAEARALFAGMHYLEDDEVTLDGVRFYGSPWQPEFLGWAFNLPRGPELVAVWAKIPAGVDVLITHAPPAGIGDRVGDRLTGCDDLRRRIEELAPPLHVFGHIHEDGGAWRLGGSTIANVTTWDGDRGASVFDLAGGVVTPVAIPAKS